MKPSIITQWLIVIFCSTFAATLILHNLLLIESPISGEVAGATTLSAEVPPTPTNQLYLELKQKQLELNNKDQELQAKERYLNTQFLPNNSAIKLLYLTLGFIFILLMLNFYLDYRRNKQSA